MNGTVKVSADPKTRLRFLLVSKDNINETHGSVDSWHIAEVIKNMINDSPPMYYGVPKLDIMRQYDYIGKHRANSTR